MIPPPKGSDPRKDVTVRAIQERDIDQVVEMHRLVGAPVNAEAVRRWCREDPYSRRLVAEVDGRAVGKVTLDTAYPPYSELVNLMVHPDYRRRGVASRLVQGCIVEAGSRGHPITLLMTEPENTPAVNLYSRNGFIDCIPGGPGEREFKWMMRLHEDFVVGRFLRDHPSSLFTPSLGRTIFYARSLYMMRWTDQDTESHLGLLLEGQPGQPARGGTAPRLAGATVKEGATAADILILEGQETIELGKEAEFRLLAVNNGEEILTIEDIDRLHPKGVTVSREGTLPAAIEPGDQVTTQFRVSLDQDFDVPILSFTTILLTLSLKIRGIEPTITVTAGFERG